MTKLYTLSEAAEYLGEKPEVIRDAYHKTKKLDGEIIGNPNGPSQSRRVVFTRQQLDQFAKWRKSHIGKRGRPPNRQP